MQFLSLKKRQYVRSLRIVYILIVKFFTIVYTVPHLLRMLLYYPLHAKPVLSFFSFEYYNSPVATFWTCEYGLGSTWRKIAYLRSVSEEESNDILLGLLGFVGGVVKYN